MDLLDRIYLFCWIWEKEEGLDMDRYMEILYQSPPNIFYYNFYYNLYKDFSFSANEKLEDNIKYCEEQLKNK